MRDRILLIEPHALIRRPLVSFVAHNGHLCQAVSAARAGIAELQRHRYRVVILDLDLPECSGSDLADTIRAIEPNVLIFGLDSAAEEHQDGMAAYPFDAIIAKPFVGETLLAKLTESCRIGDVTPLIPEA